VSTYTVSAASQHSVSDLQSQLAASTANGLFNKQLTSFAQKFNASAFVNATSTALIILTTAPTRAPSAAPAVRAPSSSSADNGLGAGPIAGLVIMAVVVAALLCAGGYFLYNRKFQLGPTSQSGGGDVGGVGGSASDPDDRPSSLLSRSSTQEDKVVLDKDLISYDSAYASVEDFASEDSPRRPPSPQSRISLRQNVSTSVELLSPSEVEIEV
jgi:hypothetical protein